MKTIDEMLVDAITNGKRTMAEMAALIQLTPDAVDGLNMAGKAGVAAGKTCREYALKAR